MFAYQFVVVQQFDWIEVKTSFLPNIQELLETLAKSNEELTNEIRLVPGFPKHLEGLDIIQLFELGYRILRGSVLEDDRH